LARFPSQARSSFTFCYGKKGSSFKFCRGKIGVTNATAPAKRGDIGVQAALRAWLKRRVHDANASPLYVGFSGGMDSCVLLHALATTAGAAALHAVHVDHGLHADSATWAAQCSTFAHALGVPCTVLRVTVTPMGTGVEDAARAARYRAIGEFVCFSKQANRKVVCFSKQANRKVVCFGADKAKAMVLTAHHQADQAETVLMKILSGAGPRGAAAMAEHSERRQFWHARPLLRVPKALLSAYAVQHGLHWIEDPSNASLSFRRNQVRALLPSLDAVYPTATTNLARFADAARADRSLLEELAIDALAQCVAESTSSHAASASACLSVPALLRCRAMLQPWIVRAWLSQWNVHLPALTRAVVALAQPETPHGQARAKAAERTVFVRRYQQQLYFEDAEHATRLEHVLHWQASQAVLELPGNLGNLAFVSDRAHAEHARYLLSLDTTWRVQNRRGGERIQLVGRPHRHALKDILQAQKIPPWRRSELIILCFADGELACVLGVCIGARFSAWLQDSALRLEWRRAGELCAPW
jgi:tRNA(Ile)-lysidine synthase